MRLRVTWASRVQGKVTLYLKNGFFSSAEPRVPYSAVTSLPVSVSAAFSAKLYSVGDTEWELVSHLELASVLLLAPNVIVGDLETTLIPRLAHPCCYRHHLSCWF